MAQSPIQPIEESRKTIAAIVQDRIRDAILTGVLKPGARIDQNRLAADLNVSLVPVREALKKLEAEGFVQIVPRRGAFVTESSLKDMQDLYFARSLLEGQAAYHAAPHLTDNDIAELERLIGEMNAALRAQEFTRFNQLNSDFHFVIYNATGSRYLCQIIRSLRDQAQRYRYRILLQKDQADAIQAEHRQILEACRARDSRALRDAVVYHINMMHEGLRAYLVKSGED